MLAGLQAPLVIPEGGTLDSHLKPGMASAVDMEDTLTRSEMLGMGFNCSENPKSVSKEVGITYRDCKDLGRAEILYIERHVQRFRP